MLQPIPFQRARTSSITAALAFVAALLPLPASRAAQVTVRDLAKAPETQPALKELNSPVLRHNLEILASDAFEGRAPATEGEKRTVQYLVSQFKQIGLAPGNPDGTYIQKVPLLGITPQPSIAYQVGSERIPLVFPGEAVAWSKRHVNHVAVTNSEMIFVGYGIVAPEYDWDDYKGVDVRGKTLVMLVNDPPIPDPSDPSQLDERMFKGKAMTYYGRWTYKYEIASKKGAEAAIIVHETGPAGYPFFVLIAGAVSENFDIVSDDKNMSRIAVEGWITHDTAKKLFEKCGKDYESLKQSAASRDFRPVPLGAHAYLEVNSSLREVESQNVIAKLDGSDPVLKNEYVIYSAHWDHLGKNQKLEGDQIFNGAMDNAAGVASLLQLARAFKALETPPRRTILFFAPTAEEKGLLGAQYYARHPLYPLDQTVANINIEGINPWGRTRDINVIGYGQSTLEDLLNEAAEVQGRKVTPDSEPEKGFYFRSDHFEFAKVGVPALYTKSGIDYLGKPADFGKQKLAEYIERDYHKVSDEIKPEWNLEGGMEDLQLLFLTGYAAAQNTARPEWKPGSEFKAARQ